MPEKAIMPLSVVPQIFYDLIARVIPGSAILILGYLTWLGPAKATQTLLSEALQKNAFKFGTYMSLFILAYILGIVLHELWVIVFKKNMKEEKKEDQIKSAIDYHNKIRTIHGQEPLNVKKDNLPPIHILHDYIRLFSDSEGYRLLKLRAEQRLCHVMVIGASILAIMNIGRWIYDAKLYMPERVWLAIIFPVIICVFWRRSYKSENYYIQGTCTQWLFVCFPIMPKQEDCK